MSAIRHALNRVKYAIPRALLDETFMFSLNNFRKSPLSLDENISNTVIKPRVMEDTNLIGGEIVYVPLDNLAPVYMDDFCMVFELPPNLIKNRKVVSALSVSYLPYNSNATSDMSGMTSRLFSPVNETVGAGARIAMSVLNTPTAATASCSLVGENTIMIKDRIRVTQPFLIKCRIANEENYENLKPSFYIAFASLCLLAVKSYIYNELIIKIDEAKLSGGQELGVFKSIVESYSDSEEMYVTMLREKWRKISMMNDDNAYSKFIRMQVSANL